MKYMDINFIIIYLTFHQNFNFLATHVDAKRINADSLLSSVEKMRRELPNSIPKAKGEIQQICWFTKFFSKHGRVWT